MFTTTTGSADVHHTQYQMHRPVENSTAYSLARGGGSSVDSVSFVRTDSGHKRSDSSASSSIAGPSRPRQISSSTINSNSSRRTHETMFSHSGASTGSSTSLESAELSSETDVWHDATVRAVDESSSSKSPSASPAPADSKNPWQEESLEDEVPTYVLALHDFAPGPDNATCLSFQAGQVIQVYNRDESGWWDGEIKDRRGWFPSNFVSSIDYLANVDEKKLQEIRRASESFSGSSKRISSSSRQFDTTPTETPLVPSFDASDPSLFAEPAPSLLSVSRASSPLLVSSPQPPLSPFHDSTRTSHSSSPTPSIYNAIANGEADLFRYESSSISSRNGHRHTSPVTATLVPLEQALSLLRRAVASRRVSHYPPSSACIISCVKSVLTSTDCLHRDAPNLTLSSELSSQRRVVLSSLTTLVDQARRAAERPTIIVDEDGFETEVQFTDEELLQIDFEGEHMVRLAEAVLESTRSFLEVVVSVGVDLPMPRRKLSVTSHPRAGGATDDSENRPNGWEFPRGRSPVVEEDTVESPTVKVNNGTPHRRASSLASPVSPSQDIAASVASLNLVVPGTPAMRAHKSLTDLRARRAADAALGDAPPFPNQPPKPGTRVPHPSITSISSSSSVSSGSADSYGLPITPSFPSGPCSTAQVLAALRASHDDLLSTIAGFIGHIHSHARESHPASKGHLIVLLRETVDTVRQLLTLVESVAKHPDVGTRKVLMLEEAKNALYTATNDLVLAVKGMTGAQGSMPSVLAEEEEERRKALHSATSVLRVSATCVQSVKVCLSRPIGEEPFIICLPKPPTPTLSEEHRFSSSSYGSYHIRRSSSSSSVLDRSATSAVARVVDAIGTVSEDTEAHAEVENLRPRSIGRPVVRVETTFAGSESSHHSHHRSMEGSESSGSLARHSEESRAESLYPHRPSGSIHSLEDKLRNGPLPSPPPSALDESSLTTPVTPVSALPVVNNPFGHDHDIRDVVYNNDNVLTCATLDVLVEKMTPHNQLVDTTLQQIFVMTWRLFVTPQELVAALERRYSLPQPPNLSEEDAQAWMNGKSKPIKFRVSNFIKTWLESYWRSDTDDAALTQLSQFVRDTLAVQSPMPAQRLGALIRARTIGDMEHVIPSNIDRTKSLDRLRDGPMLPSPVSPSEIPRPTIQKALFASLKAKNFSSISVTDFDPLELARQLTIIESKLYCKLSPEEVLEVGNESAPPAPNIKAITGLSTSITGWVTECILNERDAKKRTYLLKFFIKVADRCTGLENYATSRSILAALDSSTIQRLHNTWQGISSKTKIQFEAMRKLADHARNYSHYRSKLRNTSPPAVPFLGLYLTDLTFCRAGNPSHRKSPMDSNRQLINFNKYHKLARIVQDLQRFQVPYALKEIEEVHQYLLSQFDSLTNSSDLDDLYRRSQMVEPRANTDASSQPPISPTDGKAAFSWGSISRSFTTQNSTALT